MRKPIRTSLTALAAMALFSGSAGAALAADPAKGWVANPGTTVGEDGVVTLVDSTTDGTSYENQNLDVAVVNGDKITFEYLGDCGGGAPRVFIQGGAYNTFDQDPNNVTDEPACGTPTGDEGWFLVSGTVEGITDGTAGYTGIVNDSSDDRTIEVRNLTIGGDEVRLIANAPKADKPKKANHGQCVKASAKDGESRSAAAKSDCGKKAKANKGKAHAKGHAKRAAK